MIGHEYRRTWSSALLRKSVAVVMGLAFVVIDEQHRFGVEQRRILRAKSGDFKPHTLIMSATPIPRTLALSAYGDLSVSMIKEMPPGRTPIRTRVVVEADRQKAFDSGQRSTSKMVAWRRREDRRCDWQY